MIVALAFVGKLPSYIVESIHQIRCFYYDDIYLIIDDISSPFIDKVSSYNVNIIEYKNVIDNTFSEIVNKNIQKFCIVNGLIGREKLFIHCFERFFLLRNLLSSRNLSDCLFLELDNLIYDNPYNWLEQFSKHELCYMFDHYNRFSSGLMYIKNAQSLEPFLKLILNFIDKTNNFMTEMTVLSIYYEANKDKVQILPTYWDDSKYPQITYENYDKYNESIFDALAIGCYLLGLDPIHTNNTIVTGKKAHWCLIDYTNLPFEWKIDDTGKRRPYVFNGEKYILINNLHIHSKDLKNGLSLPLMSGN